MASIPQYNNSKLRILMQMRQNALTQRGGDTVVMEQITRGLVARGHKVDLDLDDSARVENYDLIHLYNFATPDITEQQAKKAVEAAVPYIVTTMYEDWPTFFSPMVENFLTLEQYVELEQPVELWGELCSKALKLPETEKQDNTFTAMNAGALVGTGNAEMDSLRRDYPDAKLITDYRCGCEVLKDEVDIDLFRNHVGIKDFVLCVGRLEWRKNQLMLLKALEESSLPVILATGGFTYQPQYEALCRKFRRKGKTLFIGQLEPQMLASAFAGARVHVLPSWYELPGLVSIEAANYGTNIVASDFGTIKDYLGDEALYVRPDSPEKIEAAVNVAWDIPRNTRLKERVKEFTWDRATERYLQIYSQVLSQGQRSTEEVVMKSGSSTGTNDFADLRGLDVALQTIAGASAEVSRAKETVSMIPAKVGESVVDLKLGDDVSIQLCIVGEDLVRRNEFDDAIVKFKEAAQRSPKLARAYRGQAVIALNRKQYSDSEGFFKRALLVDKDDTKSEIGIALVQAASGRKKDAVKTLTQILERTPTQLLALRQYLQIAYEIDEMPGLERVLRSYLAQDSSNPDMRFCLAGCYFKQGKHLEALTEVEQTLVSHPQHQPSIELRQQLKTSGRTVPVLTSENTAIAEMESALRSKEFAKVEEIAVELLRTSTGTEKTLVEIIRAEGWICSGRGEQAKQCLENLRDDNDFGYRATSALGVYWGSNNNWSKAAQLFKVAIALKPDHDVSLAGLGIAALLDKDKEQAWEWFSRAHAANPENIRALTGMIEVAYPLKRLDVLEQAILRYLEYVPANLSILYAHAGCAYALGKMDVATQQLNKIRLFDPNHALAIELANKIEEESRGWNQVRA